MAQSLSLGDRREVDRRLDNESHGVFEINTSSRLYHREGI
jgi:hypothetical protein